MEDQDISSTCARQLNVISRDFSRRSFTLNVGRPCSHFMLWRHPTFALLIPFVSHVLQFSSTSTLCATLCLTSYFPPAPFSRSFTTAHNKSRNRGLGVVGLLLNSGCNGTAAKKECPCLRFLPCPASFPPALIPPCIGFSCLSQRISSPLLVIRKPRETFSRTDGGAAHSPL